MRKHIRIISIFLTLAMIVSVLPMQPLQVNAQTEAASVTDSSVTVESNGYAMAGKTVEVDLILKNNPGILGMTLKVNYDESVATLISVENGNALNYMVFTTPKDLSSGCKLPWDAETVDKDALADGIIAKLTFEIAEDAPVNEPFTVELSYDAGAIIDQNMDSLSISVGSGDIYILDYLPGDLNEDGLVNTTDVVLLRRYVAGGYGVSIAETAADVNDDGILNTTDVVRIRRFVADGCTYDISGYGVKLLFPTPKCAHTMEAVAYKAATCTEEGNTLYYHCTACDKYYNDGAGTLEIVLASTVLAATNHEGTIVTHAAKEATETEVGWNEWSECTACGYQPIPYVEIPVVVPNQYTIQYYITDGTDAYLTNLYTSDQIPNPNPNHITVGTSYTLKNLDSNDEVPGYTFDGWYDGFGESATKITNIPADTTGVFEVFAKWSATEYDITYSVYGTPIEPVSEEEYKHYTTNKGLYNLPNPDLYNYIFLGWYLDDGTEVKEIPAGTTGDIKLNGYFTSERNLAKAVSKLEDPFIVEDVDNNVIYFTYELGTIENVPVSDAIWTIQNVAGLTQQISHEVTISIGTEEAQSIAQSIANATVNSSTWTLSSDWNEVTEINEQWAEEHGITKEEAETIAKSNSDSYCVSQASGGNSTTTTNKGTTTLTYDSVNTASGEDKVDESGWHIDGKVSGSYENSTTVGAEAGGSFGGINVGGSVENKSTFKVGVEVGGGYESSDSTTTYGKVDTHSGTDTTTVDTTVSESTSTWNNSQTSTQTATASKSNTVSQAISDIITSSKGYGNSYSNGGENSESQEFNFSQSESNDYSTMLTYSSAETTTTTTTYTADGKIEGKYRLVMAGTVHVFGVVGYDIATNSYFTYGYWCWRNNGTTVWQSGQ